MNIFREKCLQTQLFGQYISSNTLLSTPKPIAVKLYWCTYQTYMHEHQTTICSDTKNKNIA